jgi:hypothetical protein
MDGWMDGGFDKHPSPALPPLPLLHFTVYQGGMALITAARIAIVAIFLLLGVLTFISEVIFFKVIWLKRWRIPLAQLWIPIFIVIVGIIMISITFAGVKENPYGIVNQCPTEVDADIGGDGVRVAVWVQIVSLLLISILSSFHTSAVGVKEIGAGLILTHISLSIAMLVQLGQDTLSFADAAIGTMILDAQNMALSIQLGSKDTLASRWQVGVTTITQAFGLVVEAILISKFTSGTSLVTDQCKCLTFFWWGWISNCAKLPSQAAILWTYYACHLVASFQSNFHAIWNARFFDRAERGEKDPHSFLEDRLLDGITYIHMSDYGEAMFNEYPATVTLMYGFYGLFALTSMITAEDTMSHYELRPSSQINSVGQIIALVVAAASVARATWLLWRLFRGEKGRAFTWWPFSFRPAMVSAAVPHISLQTNKILLPSQLRIGDLVSDPRSPENKILSRNTTPLPPPEQEPANMAEVRSAELSAGIGDFAISISSLQRWTADRVYRHPFNPDQQYIRERLDSLRPEHPHLESESRCVYMVVLQYIAHDWTSTRGSRLTGWPYNLPRSFWTGRQVEHAEREVLVLSGLIRILFPKQRDGNFRISTVVRNIKH